LFRPLGHLPQRFPEAAYDRVVERSDDGIVVERDVRGDAEWAAGHFPGDPILPGVLQLEAMIQAAVAFIGADGPVDLIGLDRVRFRRAVRPGDCLRVEVRQTRVRGPQRIVKGTAAVGDEPACSATLRLFVSP